MIALTLTTLFTVVTLASLLTLTDCWLRARLAFDVLGRERALVKAGFVPMVEAEELRLRSTPRFAPAATRPFAQRLPQGLPQRPAARSLGAV
jgi:hypothetical protein